MSDLLSDLNPSQREAAETTEGYVRVLAGAGTGKTRALTRRYAYIAGELGVPPRNLLCLTFTNKAADEMKRRVRSLLGEDCDTSFVSTIHAFCVRVLREDISKLFYPEAFIVLDSADSKKLLEEIYDELGLKLDAASFRTMLDKSEMWKKDRKYIDYLKPGFDFRSLSPADRDEAVLLRYVEKQRKCFGLDFPDLINFVMQIFDRFPDVLSKWQERLWYVMVDEFQDVTDLEYQLIVRLSGGHGNLFVVGDPDQNIYQWRGSDPGIIIDFEKHLSPCRTVMMNTNYRSTPEIVAAANCLISKNHIRIEKSLEATRPGGCLPVHFHSKTEEDELKFVSDTIKALADSGTKLRDIALLYRAGYLSRGLEEKLRAENIPYSVCGGVGFYDRAEIKDILSYLRLIASGDDLSFLRVLNLPRRRIGRPKLAFIRERAEAGETSLYEAMRDNISDPIFSGCGAAAFVKTVEKLRGLSQTLPVSELLQRTLLLTGYEAYLRENGDMERLDNLSELLRGIIAFENSYGEPLTLAQFLQNVSLLRDSDIENAADRVRLMTMHTAKGLEFPVCILFGMSEGIFPSSRSLESRSASGLEEERRLAYVAVTRAEKRLYLTDSEGSDIRGNPKIPSRFLFDIDGALLERIGTISEQLVFEASRRAASQEEERDFLLSVGQAVVHKVFGDGVVENVLADDRTYLVRFPSGLRPISFSYKGMTLR